MFNIRINDKIKHTIITVFLTVILGQFYFNPFYTEFRITLGVIALTFLLIYFNDISILKTSFIVGLSVFLFRGMVYYSMHGGTVNDIIANYLPALFYYYTFGIVLHNFNIRKKMIYPLNVFFILSFSDIVSNIVEISIRNELFILSFSKIISNIFITGVIRAVASLILYRTFYSLKDLALKEEKRIERENLFVLSSKIVCEKFYLEKSMQDIETAMETSYSVYMKVKNSKFGEENPNISKKLINLSHKIHEIKKDYRRILLGIGGIVPDLKVKNIMTVENIFNIIIESNLRYNKLIEKKINLIGSCNTNLKTKDYLSLTSIINNLINNSVDAINKKGKIILDIWENSNYLYIRIKDNGEGIKKEDIGLIFNPGFSTKYDKSTGKMSTGVGLSHVNNITKDVFNGKVSVESEYNKGAVFTISIPISSMIGG